jgi:hypothetical protein
VEQYQLDRLAVKLKVVHLLLDKADERGLTHGEKHHFIHVARHLLGEIYAEIAGQQSPFDIELTEKDEPNDIPF